MRAMALTRAVGGDSSGGTFVLRTPSPIRLMRDAEGRSWIISKTARGRGRSHQPRSHGGCSLLAPREAMRDDTRPIHRQGPQRRSELETISSPSSQSRPARRARRVELNSDCVNMCGATRCTLYSVRPRRSPPPSAGRDRGRRPFRRLSPWLRELYIPTTGVAAQAAITPAATATTPTCARRIACLRPDGSGGMH